MKNRPNVFSHFHAFIKPLVLVYLIMELLKGKADTSLQPPDLLFQMFVPKYFWDNAVSIIFLLIGCLPLS